MHLQVRRKTGVWLQVQVQMLDKRTQPENVATWQAFNLQHVFDDKLLFQPLTIHSLWNYRYSSDLPSLF